ncbi:MAG TPA: prepilin-type N-terminal cleavage/methylation domain-containing protein [Savagea sp.]
MKQLKNQRGLTLIELLAVIVILAIIAAIAAVAIGNVIQNSKDKAILSDAVAMLEGAKIAHMDGSCGDDDICKKEHLEPFVEDVVMDDKDQVEIKTDKDDGTKTYEITYKKFEEIKNTNKYGVESPVEASELLETLNGGKKTTTPPAGS